MCGPSISLWVLLNYFTYIITAVNTDFTEPVQRIVENHFGVKSLTMLSETQITSNYEQNCLGKFVDIHNIQEIRLCVFSDTLLEIMQNIFIANNLPFIYTRENTVVNYRHFRIRNDNYIILSSYSAEQDVINDIKKQIKAINQKAGWNPRAKFVILLNQHQNHNADLASKLFAELSNFKIVNCIILMPQRNENLALEVYSWFPFSPPGRCADVFDAFLVDRWYSNNATGTFIYNASLFPNKIPKDFNGCPLRISTFEYIPFVGKMKYIDNSSVVYEGGLEINLMILCSELTNMTIVYRLPPTNGKWGVYMGNGTWTGITGEITSHISDVAFSGWWYRCHLIDEIECITPHLIDAVRWFVPCPKPYPRWMSTTRVFKTSIWLGFLSAYIVVALAMWKIVKWSNSISSRPIENEAYTSLVKCFLNFWAIILEESASNNPPHVVPIRAVFLMWVLYCWAVNTVYQTFLTSFLIDPGLQPHIASEDELLTSGMDFLIPDTIMSIIPGLYSKRYWGRKVCEDVPECEDRLAFKSDIALLFSKYNVEYLAAAKYMDSDGKSLVCKFDEVYSNQLIIAPVPKGSFILERFNDLFLRVLQSGVMDKWWKDIRYTGTLALASTLNEVNSEYIKLTLEHLQSAFYLLFLGCIFSIIVFVSEVLCRRR
ncbi:Ionotropic receptor 206 [Blattella germanica]|nr:Ionotropic receptor 206 [Blattella germanica]